MSEDKGKIVIPSEEEVEQFGKSDDEGTTPEPTAEESSEGQASSSEAPDDWKDKFLRAKAELVNYQRRAEKDRSDALKYANAGLIRALLPVIDDLERVVEKSDEHTDSADAIREGVKLTLDNLLKVLNQYEVKVIDCAGQEFDPACHEAMMEQPSAEHPHRTVLQELSKGYRLHDRVLRPSKVIVSKGEPAPEAEGDEPSEDDAS